ncbi:gamma-aminobutyric acid type B receptor subunit 2-like [Amphiura filiformis]|uniref:gamma-aminobutyric acid type B receptor subunit 2-like n=1 Tax=Amphiura filiformis TaxID=82378 RepID=UPI003B21DBE3
MAFLLFAYLLCMPMLTKVSADSTYRLNLLGLYPMTGSKWLGGQAMLPASELAVKHINANSSILADYELNIIVKDTQCIGSYGNNVMYEELYNKEETKIAILGGGCSTDTIPTAESSHLWNLIQVSFSSYTPVLSDRSRFPLFFRMAPGTTSGNLALVEMVKNFGWRKMATINPADYADGANDFRQQAMEQGIEIVVAESFADNPALHVANIKTVGARIIYGSFYEADARQVMCAAYKEGLFGSKYVWILPGWYDDGWWRIEDHNCTIKEMDLVTNGYLSSEVQALVAGDGTNRVSAMSAEEYSSRYDEYVNFTSDQLVGLDHAPYAYDEIWALSLALDKTDKELKLMDPPQSLLNFSYTNSNLSRLFFDQMSETKFEGISGTVKFTSTGDRLGPIQIRQNQNGTDAAVGTYNPGSEGDKLQWSTKITVHWPNGRPPLDSFIEEEEYQSISLALFAIMTVIAILGIFLAISFFTFSILYSERRIIKLTSPRLNNLIILGGVFSYLSVILLGLDANLLTLTQYEIIFKLFTVCLVIGFSVSFGALFWKTWRIHRIFAVKSPVAVKISDRQLILQVVGIAALELAVLILWEIADPRIHNTYQYNMKTDPKNDDILITVLRVELVSRGQYFWMGALFIINGLLLVFGAFLAWETRKIDMKAINDSKFIGMSIYTVVIMSFVGVPVSFIVDEPNAHYVLISIFILFSTTVTLCLIFIPKIRLRNVEMSRSTMTTRPQSSPATPYSVSASLEKSLDQISGMEPSKSSETAERV